MKISTRKLVLSGFFICMTIILRNYLSINIPILQVNFSFLPVAMCSIMLGPFLGGIAALAADILAFFIYPKEGGFFFGFSLNAFLSGWVYGIVLYKKPKSILRICIACSIVAILINIVIGTYWVSILHGQAYIALLPYRVTVNLLMIPVRTIVIYYVCKVLSQKFFSIEYKNPNL